MKLAKYLADYIKYEEEDKDCGYLSVDDLQEVIQQGLEAFVSTEDAGIQITDVNGRFSEVYR